MAVSTTDTYSGPYAANGVTVAFPFTFKAVGANDVAVIFRAVSGIETLVDDSDFSITLSAQGGTVVFPVAPPSSVGQVFVVSEPAFVQSVEFASGQPFLPSVVNEVNDRDVVRAIYLKSKVERAPQTPIGGGAEGQFPVVLPDGSWGFGSGTGADDGLRVDAASPAPDKGAALIGTTTGASIDGLIVNAPTDGKFITNLDGAPIARIGRRAFVGAAVKQSGNYPNDLTSEQDWYTQYERAEGRPNGIIVSSQMAVLTNDYFGAAIAFTAAAQTKHFIAGVGGAIAIEGHVVNNNIVTAHDAWGIYSEGTRDSDGVGQIITCELDARNKGAYWPIHPYAQSAKMSVTLQLASGAALSGVGVEDASAGINFRENPTKFGAGIVFGNNSIRGTDGSGTGIGNAILMARGHQIAWTNAAGAQVGFIRGVTGDSAGAKMGVTFDDLGLLISGPSDSTAAIFRAVATSANYLDFYAAISSVAPRIAVSGTDTNIDLTVQPKGTGLLRFGTATSFIANSSGAGSIGSTVPTGFSLTPTKWLTVKDAAGAQGVIPFFGLL